jgi:uncharacterized protein (DUF1800 family)
MTMSSPRPSTLRRLAFAALFISLLAGCGGSSDDGAGGGQSMKAQAPSMNGEAASRVRALAAPASAPATLVLGNDSEGDTTDFITDSSGAYINASRFQAVSARTITTVNAKVGAITGKYQVAVYADANGNPGELLASSVEVTPTASGWTRFALRNNVTATAGASYWLAIWSDDPAARVYTNTSNGDLRWAAYSYSTTWPTTLNITGSSGYQYAIYATDAGTTQEPDPNPAPGVPGPQADAARLLNQASFGATTADIDRVVQIGHAAWIDEQLAAKPTLMRPYLLSLKPVPEAGINPLYDVDILLYGWWKGALSNPDQLRQRVAFALSQIFVISTENSDVGGYRYAGASHYYDTLIANSLGSYRNLLEQVTRHPMMGLYLSHLGNKKEDPVSGIRADENFAREVMQLFSIGLVELNPDGTPKLANGAPIPTYNKSDVEGLAKVFTGWGWNYPKNTYFWDGSNTGFVFPEVLTKLMMPVPAFHSTSEKKFLGVTIPVQSTSNPKGDLRIALDRLASHPNVGPFIGRRLIQHLVTSNPSPQYVARVTAAFNASSGNLGAMVRAILLDPEARSSELAQTQGYGRLREPLLRLAHFARAMNLKSGSGYYGVGNRQIVGDPDAGTAIGQTPLGAPSVFNFFRPGYTPPNTTISKAGLVAPEFQIFNEISTGTWIDALEIAVEQGFGGNCCAPQYWRDITTSYTPELALADRPDALIDRLNLLLLSGQMSKALRDDVRLGIQSVALPSAGSASTLNDAKRRRVQMAVLMTMASPEYLVQK